jgi:streptogramin lyase
VSENVPGQERTTVVLLRGRSRRVLAKNLRGVHGILVTAKGLVLSESYAGRVLRLDPVTHAIAVLARGLGNPSFTAPAPAGGYYVSEFAANRISYLHANGRVTKVADVLQPGPIALDSRRRLVGASLSGAVFRIEGGRARTIYP